jgi:hypothetical protein
MEKRYTSYYILKFILLLVRYVIKTDTFILKSRHNAIILHEFYAPFPSSHFKYFFIKKKRLQSSHYCSLIIFCTYK